ncbi:hypothetical protein RchiOBHm_Chr5g0067791 [Rosa chinensis]|uniref:Uncharacterized protein n=1 Tax=Rosa chinensis TaxID=74649 RepID=A0A2P6QJJ3_ROSCH|nr:hypothetical protein RchiOBHm_Chr5g0067791 [Rosa chinensis]
MLEASTYLLGLLWFLPSFVATGLLHSRWVVSFNIRCLHYSSNPAATLCRHEL